MSPLTYFSTLEDVIACNEENLRNGIGNLAPEVVTQYVFFLRRELDNVRNDLQMNILQYELEKTKLLTQPEMTTFSQHPNFALQPPLYNDGLINLALYKENVCQSSTGWGGDLLRAVDGNTDGVYTRNGVTHTDPNIDNGWAWWHCDLEGWFKIKYVRIYNRVECAERLDGATVLLGKKIIGIVQFKKGQQLYEFPADNYSSNSVTVILTSKKPLSLAQVEVWGTGVKEHPLYNVALKRPCLQSTVSHGGDPSRAVNGVEDPRYDSGNTTHTDHKNERSAWWHVVLDKRFRIYEVNVMNRLECAERINKAQVFLDGVLIHTIKYQSDVLWYHIPVQGIRYAKKIEVKLNTGHPLSLAEVVVMSDLSIEPVLMNIAVQKSQVSQSSTGWGGEPHRAVDGSNDGVYSRNGVTHTDPKKDNLWAWWHCDLEDWYKIRAVKIYNRVECAQRLNNATVMLGKKKIGTVQYEKGQQVYKFLADDYSSRDVTVVLTTGLPLSLAQVEVYGTGERGIALCDVALGKACFQSSVAHDGDPNRAVNGVEDPRYDSGNTTHTDPNKDGSLAWWYVDLEYEYRIYEINILGRFECAERIDKATVFLDSQLVHTIKYTPGVVGWYHIPMTEVVYGRRVEIKLETGKPLSLTEVVVLSDRYVNQHSKN